MKLSNKKHEQIRINSALLCTLLFVIISAFPTLNTAQNGLDSIYKVYNSYSIKEEIPDTVIYELISLSIRKNIFKIELLLSEFRKLQHIKDSFFYYKINYAEAHLIKKQKNYEKALSLFTPYLNFIIKEDIKEDLVDANYYIGQTFHALGNYNKALLHYTKARDHAHQKDPKWIGLIALAMGEINSDFGYNKKAIEAYQYVIEQHEIDDTSKAKANMLLIGTYLDQDKLEEAQAHNNQLLEIAARNNFVAFVLRSDLYRALISFERAEYNKAIDITYELKDKIVANRNNYDSKLSCLSILAKSLYKKGEFNKSKKIFNELSHFSTEFSDQKYKRTALKGLIHCHSKLNNPEELIGLIDSLSDSHKFIQKKRSKEKIHRIKDKYKSEKKEARINLLNAKNEIAELKLTTAKRTNQFAFIGIILLTFISFLLYNMLSTQKKSKAELLRKNKLISSMLKDKELLLKEIHHRVKNNLQVVSSLLSLQSEYIRDDKALNAIKEGRNRVKSMALIHQNLYQDNNLSGIKVDAYFSKLVAGLFNSYDISQDRIELQLDIDDIVVDVDTIIPLGLITNELISNALKYAFPNNGFGQIKVKLKQSTEKLTLQIEDDGQGFDSSIVNDEISSFGYQMILAFCKKLDASLEIINTDGTMVCITMINEKNIN